MEIRDVCTFREFTDKNSGEKKKMWFKVGSAFFNPEFEGISIELTALPVNGRLSIFKKKPQEQKAPEVKNESEDLPF